MGGAHLLPDRSPERTQHTGYSALPPQLNGGEYQPLNLLHAAVWLRGVSPRAASAGCAVSPAPRGNGGLQCRHSAVGRAHLRRKLARRFSPVSLFRRLISVLRLAAAAVPVRLLQLADTETMAVGICMVVMCALVGVSAAAGIPTVTIGKDAKGAPVQLPMSGIGTWQYNDTVAEAAVALALTLGYTHIDTAIGYDNQVGIAKALKASTRPRESYFVTSKIPGGLDYADATKQLEQSIQQLGLPYVDMMLVHFPATWGGKGGKELRQAGWKALEDFYKAGKTRAIGISHYCEAHIADILEVATVLPAVNQVQYHVGMGAPSTSGLNMTDMPAPSKPSEQPSYKGIIYQSFSPLCGPCGTTELIDGPLVTSIGKAHGKSGAQVSLKWQIQRGIPVIPKTHQKEYMLENIDL
eukprot:COSAG06_NODE_364_length_16784_cov_21.917231_4_plen_410_part_00